MQRNIGAFFLVALAIAGRPAAADVWDVQTFNDNTPATSNELAHGTIQTHDLGALAGPPVTADQDFYVIGQKPFSSYEVVVDGASGDFGASGPQVDLVLQDGSTIVTSSVSITPGRDYARSLRFVNATAASENLQYVRVLSVACGTSCGTDDQYAIRLYETTLSAARFNNSGTQITSFILQNPTNYTISGTIYYWSAPGGLVQSQPFSLAAKQILNTNTSVQTGQVGGSITVAHDGRYGDLQGKAAAVEPATGFTFDTQLVPRLH